MQLIDCQMFRNTLQIDDAIIDSQGIPPQELFRSNKEHPPRTMRILSQLLFFPLPPPADCR